jgi:hypothetical protein
MAEPDPRRWLGLVVVVVVLLAGVLGFVLSFALPGRARRDEAAEPVMA